MPSSMILTKSGGGHKISHTEGMDASSYDPKWIEGKLSPHNLFQGAPNSLLALT